MKFQASIILTAVIEGNSREEVQAKLRPVARSVKAQVGKDPINVEVSVIPIELEPPYVETRSVVQAEPCQCCRAQGHAVCQCGA